MISVITCTKNSANTLSKTIDSVNKQSFKNFEHIFIDNFSEDKTIEIIKNAKNYILFQNKLKLYEALNFGISKAKYDIVFFLHSDDFLIHDDIFYKIEKIFLKNKKTNLIYSNIVIINKKGKVLRNWNAKNLNNFFFRNFIFPAHTSIFYRKNLLSSVGNFDTNYKISSDFDHMYRVFSNTNTSSLFFDKYTVTMNAGGISNKSFKSIIYQNYENFLIMKKHNKNIFNIICSFMLKIFVRILQKI